MCHHPNKACPGVSDCGKKSRCVQRYNYQVGKNQTMKFNNLMNMLYFQLLLSLPSSLSSTSLCPSIRAFKFPSGCVCHAETKSDQDLVSDTNSHHHNGHLFFQSDFYRNLYFYIYNLLSQYNVLTVRSYIFSGCFIFTQLETLKAQNKYVDFSELSIFWKIS